MMLKGYLYDYSAIYYPLRTCHTCAMEYLTREELVRLFKIARNHKKLHHVAMLVGLLHGLRVSEMLAIRGRDICDGKLSVKPEEEPRSDRS